MTSMTSTTSNFATALASFNPTSANVALYGDAVALLKSLNFRNFKTEQLGSSLIAVLMPLATTYPESRLENSE